MKSNFTLILILIVNSVLKSQTAPEKYTAKIPALPQNACSLKGIEKTAFLEKVNKLDEELKSEISPKEKSAEDKYKSSAEQMKQNLSKQYGLSTEDMKKLQSGKLSESEKRALADKMLQKKANISLEEAERVGKMSKAGQKAWAEGYSTEQMANVQANPDTFKTEQNKNMKNYELAKQQSLLIKKIHAADDKYMEQIKELDKKDSIATKELNAKRKPLMDEYANSDNTDEIISKVRTLEHNYCNKLTPEYFKILNDRLITLKRSLPDYEKLEEVNSKLNQSTMGVDKDLSEPGLISLQAIESYVSLLKSAFKYANYTFPEE